MTPVFDDWMVEYTLFSALTSVVLHFSHKHIYGVRVFFLEEREIISYSNSSNWLVFVIDTKSVSTEAGTVLAYMLTLTHQGIAQDL